MIILYMVFLLPLTLDAYHLAGYGQYCSDSSTRMTTRAACQAAAAALGFDWGNGWYGPGDFAGCLYTRDKVYFNYSPHASNDPSIRPDYAEICTGAGASAKRENNNIHLIQTIQLGEKPFLEETKFPNIKSAFYGYDLVTGDPTALSPLQQGYTNYIFDVDFERSVNFNNTDVKKALSCDVTFKATLVSTGESYMKSVISTSQDGSNFQYGNQVQVEVPVEGAKVSATFPPPYQSAASNSKTMSHFTSALNTNLFTMAKTKAECYRYLVQIKTAQHPPFTKQFVTTAINYELCMIENKKREDKMKCARKFLDNYGAHYIKSAGMGSSITFTRMYQNSKTQKMSEHDKKKCAVHNTKVDLLIVSFGSDSTKCTDDNSEYSSFSEHSVEKTTMVTRGSTPDKSMADWAKQGGSPEIIQMILSPISNLFTTDYFKENEFFNLTQVKSWLEHDIANYCEIFKEEYRCKYVVRWNFTTPATCKIYPDLNGIWTGPLDSDVRPNGIGTFWTAGAQEQKLNTYRIPFDHGCPSLPSSLPHLPGVLLKGNQLHAGKALYSTNGEYSLWMKKDGNLVVNVNSNNVAIWTSGTHSSIPGKLIFENNGNLAVQVKNIWNKWYTEWISETNGTNAHYLIMQNNGNLVLYADDLSQVWSTGTIYLMFGGVSKQVPQEEIYSPNADIVCDKPIPKIPEQYIFNDHVVFVHNSVVYLCGGFSENTRNICISQDLSDDSNDSEWKTYDNHRFGRRSQASIVMQNRVYMIGGQDMVGPHNIWSALPLQDPPVFKEVPNLEYYGRQGICLVKLNEDSFIAMGGFYTFTDVKKYIISAQTTTVLPSLPGKRTWLGCEKVEQNGKVWIVVAGGYYWGAETSHVVAESARLDLEDGDAWEPLGKLNVPRYQSEMVSTDYGLMMLGSTGYGDIKSVEVLDWNTKQWKLYDPSLQYQRITLEATVEVPAALLECRKR